MCDQALQQIDDSTRDTPEKIIRVGGLSKSYGETVALDNVSFSVRSGEILGYLGPNGAGKTTTINVLSGLLRRDTGDVRICGADIDRDAVAIKQQIGVVPEESNLYPELTSRRNLEYIGELYGLSRTSKRSRAYELMEAFDLVDKRETPFRSLSRGMKRRLTIAGALMHSPRLVFLDEPTAGLDVPSARSLRALIREINHDGTTIFLSTHNLPEAESLCDRVVILVKGRVVAEGTATTIRQQFPEMRRVSFVLSADVAAESLQKACPAVKTATFADGMWKLEVSDAHTAVTEITAFAQETGIRILEISSVPTSLEDTFMSILEANTADPETNR